MPFACYFCIFINVGLGNLPTFGTAASADVGTGANQIPDMNSFISSIGSTGFQTLPGGRIEQWGQNTITSGGASVITLPMAVPNGVLHSIVTFQGSQGNTPESVWVSASTKTTITISHSGDNTLVVANWRIICN